jgi:hypothetical protein
LGGKGTPQRGETPTLQRLDRLVTLAEDGGGLFDGEVGDDPQGEDVALIGRETVEERLHPVVCEPRDHVRFDVAARRLGCVLERRLGDPASATTRVVDRRVVGDGEQPGTEPVAVTLEGVNATECPDEHVVREPFGVADAPGAEVSDHGCARRSEQRVEAAPVPHLGLLDRAIEFAHSWLIGGRRGPPENQRSRFRKVPVVIGPRRFSFAFEPRFEPLLFAIGVTPRTAWVDVDDERIDARFGPWTCTTPRSNVREVCLTGPYRWYTAIGARLSLADRGLTFGTTPRGGVCMLFREPVTGLDPFGAWRHPGLTVTVADAEGLAACLRT